MTGPRRFNSLVVADRLIKSRYCVTFALLPPTVGPCTVLLQYTLPLNSLTVWPCHCIQYTLPPTCSTVVTQPMLLTALYCFDTVMLPLFNLALYCLQYTLPTNGLVLSCFSTCCLCLFRPCIVYSTRCLLTALYCPTTVHAASVYFGPVLSTVHAACLRHPVLQSSDSYPRLQTVTLQSLACLGTKTSIIASVIAFSHNLSLGSKLAQDGSPCHAPISKKMYCFICSI